MDDVRRWRGHGRDHACGCYVPALAAHNAFGRLVSQYWVSGARGALFRHRDREISVLYLELGRRQSWHMGVPETVCRCWIRELPLSFLFCVSDVDRLQVESFIPLWEWDLPKKKSKKTRKGKESKSTPAEKLAANGAYIEEVEDSGEGSSRPHSRSATVEDVPEE